MPRGHKTDTVNLREFPFRIDQVSWLQLTRPDAGLDSVANFLVRRDSWLWLPRRRIGRGGGSELPRRRTTIRCGFGAEQNESCIGAHRTVGHFRFHRLHMSIERFNSGAAPLLQEASSGTANLLA